MDEDNSATLSVTSTPLGHKSWTAYVRVGLLALLLLLVIAPLAWSAAWYFGVAVLLVSAPYLAYKFMLIHSYKLYFDDVGVWVYSGILPWKKGVSGVKWRDLDESVYFQTFWSWVSKSYSIRIGHRFTKTNEIFLTHMAKGHASVIAINARHQEMIRENRLT